jgi:hypothetical protein
MNAGETATASPGAERVGTRTTRRQVRKQPSPVAEQKVKTAICLSSRAYRQLGIASVMESKTQSDLIEQWISDHCRRYVVHDRGHIEVSADSSDTVNPAA